MKKGNKGFTLIELLVVIAIIAILSTVVMAGLNSARQKGRDAKRLSDIKQVQSALELCFDNGVGYPAITSATKIGAVGGLELATNCASGATTIPFSTYMNPLPENPAPGGIDYLYCGSAGGKTCGNSSVSYVINFKLEGQSGSLKGNVNLYATPSGIIE